MTTNNMKLKKINKRIATLEMLNLELLEAIQILSLKVDNLRDDIEDQNAEFRSESLNPCQNTTGGTSNSNTYFGTSTIAVVGNDNAHFGTGAGISNTTTTTGNSGLFFETKPYTAL